MFPQCVLTFTQLLHRLIARWREPHIVAFLWSLFASVFLIASTLYFDYYRRLTRQKTRGGMLMKPSKLLQLLYVLLGALVAGKFGVKRVWYGIVGGS